MCCSMVVHLRLYVRVTLVLTLVHIIEGSALWDLCCVPSAARQAFSFTYNINRNTEDCRLDTLLLLLGGCSPQGV